MSRPLGEFCVVDENLVVRNKEDAGHIPEVSLAKYLFDQSKTHGDKTLFIDNPSGRTWTCSQIRDAATKIAAGLINAGLKEGEVVCGFCLNNDLHALSQLGIYAAAGVYAGCYWTNTLRELHHYVATSEAVFIFCSESNFEKAESVADDENSQVRVLVVIDRESDEISKTKRGRMIYSLRSFLNISLDKISTTIPVPLSKSPKVTPVAILFSSGSTGNPKGVIRTHFNQVAHNEVRKASSAFGSVDSRCTCHQPLPHLSGFNSVQNSLTAGVTIVFNPEFEVQSFLETVQNYKITNAYLAPSYIVLLLKSGKIPSYDLTSLKMVVTGGACLPDAAQAEAIEKLQLDNLRQFYGSTEAGGITRCPLSIVNTHTIGVPGPGNGIKIVDPETGRALGPNQVGEAYLQSPEVSPGYLKNPEATAENFTSDGFVKSGDAMYYDEDGFFFIVDRYKEMIKVDTQQVAPAELESILSNHKAVKEVAIVGIPSEEHGQIPKAYVALNDGFGGEDLKQELIEFLNKEVGEWKKLLGGIEYIKELPKISVGKVDRVAIKKLSGHANC